MATKIEGTPTRGKYPWHEWTDGGTWEIVKDEDYRITTNHMQISLHGRARMEGLRVKTNSFTDRGLDSDGFMKTREGLVFQYERTDDE